MRDIQVVGKTNEKPSGPYHYWTTLGRENVNLADHTANLPPGRYEVFWDFRGNYGDSFEFEIKTGSGNKLLTVSRKISSGPSQGSQYFTVPKQ